MDLDLFYALQQGVVNALLSEFAIIPVGFILLVLLVVFVDKFNDWFFK